MADDQRNPWQVPQGGSTPANAESSDSNNLNQGGSSDNDNQEQVAPADHPTVEQPTETIPMAPAAAPDQPTTPLPAVPAGGTAPNAGAATPEPYRPSPEYGAYNPAAPQTPASPTNGQPTYGQNIPAGPFNPYPFGAPEPEQSQDGQSNNGQQQNQSGLFGFGNPFAAQNHQQGGAQPHHPQQSQPQQPQQPGGQVPPQVPPTPFAQGGGQQPGPQGVHPNGKASATTVVTAVVAAVLSAALMLGLGWAGISQGWITVPSSSSMNSLSSHPGGSGSATAKSGEAPDWKTVASDVSASVVSITTQLSNGTGKGSGAIIDKDGHIVTNNHVVSGAQQIQVTLSNGNLYSAQLVGPDTTTDFAVIKLDNAPSDLPAVTFADSDTLAVGENIMAVGNPLGYANTVTTGIVSALNRPVTVQDEDSGENIFTNAVQIDAAINPGNSGGPTFNAAGQVIGINSSIASTASSSSSAGSIGIGFAIPSNLVKRVTDEIVKNGKVQHVALGITVNVAKAATATADGVTRAGAGVNAVTSGGPAEKAGVKAGDVIVGYNGKSVTNSYSLLGFVRASAMGDTAKLTVVRDGKTIELTVTLDQEESAVNGSSSSSGNSQNQNNNRSNGNGSNSNGSNGQTNPYGNSGNGSNGSNDSNGNGNSDGDNGGLSDPFSQLFGWN